MQEGHSLQDFAVSSVSKQGFAGLWLWLRNVNTEAGKNDRACQENSRVIADLLGDAGFILS